MEKYLKQLSQKELSKMTSIAKAAAKLFDEKGYLETSMDDISSAAKLSKGGIYHYFSSKNEILYFISTNFMGFLLKDLEQQLEKIGGNLEKIQFIISRHILPRLKPPSTKGICSLRPILRSSPNKKGSITK
jgi:AcrR family transcriptional regulator